MLFSIGIASTNYVTNCKYVAIALSGANERANKINAEVVPRWNYRNWVELWRCSTDFPTGPLTGITCLNLHVYTQILHLINKVQADKGSSTRLQLNSATYVYKYVYTVRVF